MDARQAFAMTPLAYVVSSIPIHVLKGRISLLSKSGWFHSKGTESVFSLFTTCHWCWGCFHAAIIATNATVGFSVSLMLCFEFFRVCTQKYCGQLLTIQFIVFGVPALFFYNHFVSLLISTFLPALHCFGVAVLRDVTVIFIWISTIMFLNPCLVVLKWKDPKVPSMG